MTSLKVSATLPASPVQSAGKRTEKFPRLNAINASSNCFISTLFSPLKRAPFALRAIETEVDFFIEDQESERKGLTDREFRFGNNAPISRRPIGRIVRFIAPEQRRSKIDTNHLHPT